MVKKYVAVFLAAVMVCLCVLGGFSPKAAASETYITESSLANNGTAAPAKDAVVPDANQYRYQKEEIAAFCHFGPNTFTGREWGDNYGDTPAAELFTLTEDFDAETLVSTLKEAGFQKLIVTAKHHDGFCIWDSAYTEYDVAATAYRDANGNSDILAEISAACTQYDMDMGLYLSPWDINAESYGYYDEAGNPVSNPADDYLDYNDYYNNQLIEILSDNKYGNDGHFTEVWMDGAKGDGANAQEYDFLRWFETIQNYEGIAAGFDADCMLFGAQAYTTVRWIGNELGYAAEETWSKSTVDYDANTINSNSAGGYTKGFENGNKWTVPEADARITDGWFWGAAKSTPKSIEDLAYMYFNSVGHNSVLLLNVPPNNQGTVDKAILDRVKEFGDEIKQTFQTNLAASAEASATQVRGNDIAFKPSNVLDGSDDTYWTVNDGTTTASMLLDLGEVKEFDVVSIEEAIQFGQRIKSFTVEYRVDEGQWQTFDEGTTVGAKRLCRKTAVRADQLKITITTSEAVPMISEVGIYKASAGFEQPSSFPSDMDFIDITDSAFNLVGGWTHQTGGEYINGTNAWANGNTNGSVYAQLSFTGSKVYLLGTYDPNHGEASVYIDDKLVSTIDTNASTRSVGQVIFESETLTAGQHTLKLVCTENGKAIGLEAAYVINNGGLGMIGLEKSEYTMEEDSEIEIKLIRVGGSTGEVTVTVSPNPGSAVQGDFDADLVEVITFADGETEKTATVRTKRNTNKTGAQYFTAELSSENESIVLGLVSKAKIWINDMEATDRYTSANPFVFPNELNASKVLEAEFATLTNSGENETWPLTITEKDWASNGKIVNSLNRGDRIDIPYVAEKAGVYTVTVTYRSGATTNYLSWYEADGKITAGTASAGNADASVTKTAVFTLVVETAGAGTLTFAPTTADSPQLDKFDIVLTEIDDSFVPEKPDPDPSQPVDPSEPEESNPTDPSEPEESNPTDPSEPEESEPTVPTEPKPQVPACKKDESCVLSKYIDIIVNDWYHDGVHFCVEEGIMNGMSDTTFAPNEPTTRAQLVTMLYRLEGKPSIEGLTEPFTDVTEGEWYYDAIVWAYNNKVVNGMTETTFEPNTNVSREQVATILYRYLESPVGTGKLDTYPDVDKVQSYAKDALIWAVGEKLINGVAQEDGTSLLDPAGNATRAQIATILMRYLTAE